MSIDVEIACTTCKELFWVGSAKEYSWLGFQFGNKQVFSWFARHSRSECIVSIGNDTGQEYLWEAGLSENERKLFKYMAYDIESSQWQCVHTETDRDSRFENNIDVPNYFPNLRGKDYQVDQPFTTDNKPINALFFSFEMSDINKADLHEYDIEEIESFKNPLIIHYKDLTIEDITFEWAHQIFYLASEFIPLSVNLVNEN